MSEPTVPESLVERIRAGRAALVVGTGVGVPSWRELLEKMNARLAGRDTDEANAASQDVTDLLEKGSLTRAAGFLARTLGPEACDELVVSTWETPEELPDVAKALALVPVRHMWTTFPGDLLETAFTADPPEDWPECQVLTYQQASEISQRKRTMVKILGDFESYVVTPKSVRQALAGAADLREYAREYYTSGTLIFVGFRYDDPDLAALLDRVFGLFELPENNHFFVGADPGPVTVEELKHEHHIEVVELEGDDEVTALEGFLRALADKCGEAALSLAQKHPDADDLEGWLAAWQDDPEAAREAVEAMTEAAREADDADRLIDILVGRVEQEESAVTRAELLRLLAEVFDKMVGDQAQAFTALTAALRENPTDTTAVEEAERLAGETGNWTELITDVAEAAEEIEDRAVAASYWTRLGHWYDAHTDHPDYAIAAFRQAIKLSETESGAHAGLEEVFRKQQRWADLADALSEHAQVENDAEQKIEIYLALGDLCENQLASTARAIEAYQASSELDESNDDALVALERLYRRDEHWDKLVDTMERHAALWQEKEPARAANLRRQVADLRMDKLSDIEGAISGYEAALEADEGDLDALRALESLYEKAGKNDEYLRTLERHIDAASEADKPTLLLRLAAEVEERDSARAAASYEQILALDEAGPAIDDAFRALERLHGRTESWTELVATYERHLETAKDKGARVELHGQLAKVYEEQLQDYESALVAWLSVRDLENEHRGALTGLARLYQRTEAWERAIGVLVEHAQLEKDSGADLWHQAGALIIDHHGDLPGDATDWQNQAEAHLEKALELDSGHRDALLSLARLHRLRSSWTNALEMLVRAQAHTPNRLERVEILIEAADLAESELSDDERSLALRQQVLELDPEHEQVGRLVSERLIADESWQDALPILEMLARKAEDSVDVAWTEHALGKALAATGELDDAIGHYRKAYEADGNDPAIAQSLAGALFARAKTASNDDEEEQALADRWGEVDTLYREVLARHRPSLDDTRAADIWHDLGVTARSLGTPKKAKNAFQRALEIAPEHKPSLSGLFSVATELEDYSAALQAKRALIDHAETDAERMQLHTEVGDLMHGKMDDIAGALDEYEEALALEPHSHVILHKMLELFIESEEWDRAIGTLDDLASHDDSAHRRAKYHYTAAVIARDKLNEVDIAVDRFDQTLDDDPSEQRAFTAIDEMLREAGNYRKLAQAYRRMLERLGPDAPVEQLLPMWSRLATIYSDQLGDTEAAIAAMEVVAAMEPNSEKRHEELANLYLEAKDAHGEEAISELQLLLQKHPERIELYRALSDLYSRAGADDKAYCLARALVFLNAATAEEQQRFARHRPSHLVVAARRLTKEHLSTHIVHPDENRSLSAIFGALVGAIAATSARTRDDLSLRAEERAEVGRDARRVVARVFKYASDILAIDPEPHLYVRDDKEGLRVLNTRDGGSLLPSVVVGDPHASAKDDRMLAFAVGKQLAYLHPERYVNYALGSLAELESAFVGILSATSISEDKPTGDAAKMAQHLKKIVPGAVLDQVRAVAVRLVDESPGKLVANWRSATDLTTNRVGLLLCNDLEIAARLVATNATAMTTLPAKERLRDLLVYSVSEPYFQMREHLCLTIDDTAQAG